MNINNAILHVLDFESCANVFAETPLSLADKTAKRYVTSQAKRTLTNMDRRRGSFEENSSFAAELRAYVRGERDFVGLSTDIAQFLARELGSMEKTPSTDVLVVDFEGEPVCEALPWEDEPEEAEEEAAGVVDGTPDAPWEGDGASDVFGEANMVAAAAREAVARARQDAGPRYFAVILLESHPAYMHEVGANDFGDVATTVARHHAILPNPSQKVASFAVVELATMDVWFVDKVREVAGEKRLVLPEGLLQCSSQASSKEVIQAVASVVEEVADQFGANSAVALSKAKAYVAENADADEDLDVRELGERVFSDQPQVRERFERAIEEKAMPEQVSVERDVARKVTRNHKIRTDTGIELTFPAEYGDNPDFIEFFSTPDGRIEIALKNIGSIENR